eukprot:gnl/MRDRNA2_/MRDRNA2_41143_c0_seq2.p1 gnl/MRDRNA2_/MRDRNA2_41143_c0~~gnl/MRDRNA2_/MRDRNA2_41143_c0_seq2.p1  ORF type:complete len:177 (+),score=28.47 gnl/MRDRNA2_/MRDRNA2_41143_c0_seq2:43-573(+)
MITHSNVCGSVELRLQRLPSVACAAVAGQFLRVFPRVHLSIIFDDERPEGPPSSVLAEGPQGTLDPELRKRIIAKAKEDEDDMAKLNGSFLIGGFQQGQFVQTAKDLVVRGRVIVKQGTPGTVLGAAKLDPEHRITVSFLEHQQDQRMNVQPEEIKELGSRESTQLMQCLGRLRTG